MLTKILYPAYRRSRFAQNMVFRTIHAFTDIIKNTSDVLPPRKLQNGDIYFRQHLALLISTYIISEKSVIFKYAKTSQDQVHKLRNRLQW